MFCFCEHHILTMQIGECSQQVGRGGGKPLATICVKVTPAETPTSTATYIAASHDLVDKGTDEARPINLKLDAASQCPRPGKASRAHCRSLCEDAEHNFMWSTPNKQGAKTPFPTRRAGCPGMVTYVVLAVTSLDGQVQVKILIVAPLLESKRLPQATCLTNPFVLFLALLLPFMILLPSDFWHLETSKRPTQWVHAV